MDPDTYNKKVEEFLERNKQKPMESGSNSNWCVICGNNNEY